MKRLDRLLDEMRKRYGNQKSVTVHFLDGSSRKLSFPEAFRLCVDDPNVTDATTGDETGTSLLRAIIGGDNDFSEFDEFVE